MTKMIAEIGINHNGDLNIAKKLIDLCAFCDIDYVKFQKRNPDICVPESQKNKMKTTPWGIMTYLDYKKHIEFDYNDYAEIDAYCKSRNIGWFASVWDLQSAEFMTNFKDIVKIPSAHLTNSELLKYCRKKFNTLILSTGMSTEREIEEAVRIGNPDIIFHTNSVYPTPIADLYLSHIKWLQEKYPDKEIGYSSHYYGVVDVYPALTMGVSWIEKHITLDQGMFGSDQKSSTAPKGLITIVKGIGDMKRALAKGYGPRELLPGEEEKKQSLRG